MYSISAIRSLARLNIAFWGSLHDFDLVAFRDDLRAAAKTAQRHDGHFDLLVDFTASTVMPQQVAADADADIAWLLANGMRRSANVVGSVLVKMQVKRIAPDPRFQTFATRAEASAWLDSLEGLPASPATKAESK